MQGEHNFILENREKLILSGVRDVGSFNDAEVVVFTSLGELKIKGKDLQILRVSVESEKSGSQRGSAGEMEIVGKIYSATYSDNTERVPNNFITKIFK